MALFTVTTNSYVNQPPTQVGNGAAETDYGVAYVFSVSDFTTLTTPAYSDPEGDSAYQLKVTGLPSTGVLKLSGSNVTLNQIINFTSISSGLLTYVPDNGTTTEYDDTFNFEIADSGSQQFVG
tara:strand:- start:63217 stop:63585 length:369 start_codon:yes stop_codon:yes gene_type:complete